MERGTLSIEDKGAVAVSDLTRDMRACVKPWEGTGHIAEKYMLRGAKRIDELEADLQFVRDKLIEYVESGYDPGMMGPTLDDMRHRLLDGQR